MIENFENVEKIKLIDLPMYNEYSVIILYLDGNTQIIELDTGEEAEILYNSLNSKLQEFKLQKKNDLAL